jgi:AbrB family looped-hinge helix DNA binding protein
MREIQASVTDRGQVTIPSEVRKALGLKARDKVTFCIDGNEVRIKTAAFSWRSAFGSVKPVARPEDLNELSRLAFDELAERSLKKMRAE